MCTSFVFHLDLFLIFIFYIFLLAFWLFFIDRTAEDMTSNRLRERGSDTQQRALGRDSNLRLLQLIELNGASSDSFLKQR